jgi:transcriptional regulator with XRE-family HTH domain
MTTGQKITNLRKKSNITQEQLADLVNVSRQSVSKWESDSAYPETDKLISLSKIFNCSVDYLLREDSNDEENSVDFKNESGKYSKHNKFIINKKGRPLAIADFSIAILSFIILAISSMTTQIYLTGFGIIDLTVSFYDVVFSTDYMLGNIPFLITFLSIFIIVILSGVYLFNDNHTVYISLKILTTCMAFFYCLSLIVVFAEANGTFYLCAILYIVYIIVLWLIKPFRFAQQSNPNLKQ